MKRFAYFVILVAAFILILVLITDRPSDTLSGYNYICFSITTFVSIYSLSKLRYAYSLNMFFWLFILFFMGVIPLMQYAYNQFPWSPLSPLEVLKGNIIVLIFISVYKLIFWLRVRTSINRRYKPLRPLVFNKINYKFAFILFLLSVISILSVRTGSSLFLRSSSAKLSRLNEDNNLSQTLLIDKVSRYFIFYFFIYTYFFRNKMSKLTRWLVYFLSVLTNFPLAVARYFVASFYIGLILNVKRQFKSPFIISTAMIVVLALVFPILTLLRYSYATLDYVIQNFSSIMGQFWSSPDFDAFSMLCRTIKYVDSVGSSFGYQLLGVLFFFIPRSIWPTKPIGSGHVIAQWYGFVFENLSSPLPAEGLINFGISGVIIFAIIIACITERYDRYYWYRVENRQFNFWILVYPAFIGLYFFMLRGDLLSSYAYIFGMFVPCFFMNKVLNFKRKGNKLIKY